MLNIYDSVRSALSPDLRRPLDVLHMSISACSQYKCTDNQTPAELFDGFLLEVCEDAYKLFLYTTLYKGQGDFKSFVFFLRPLFDSEEQSYNSKALKQHVVSFK